MSAEEFWALVEQQGYAPPKRGKRKERNKNAKAEEAVAQ